MILPETNCSRGTKMSFNFIHDPEEESSCDINYDLLVARLLSDDWENYLSRRKHWHQNSSNKDTDEGPACDVNCDLLVARLLGRGKENRSCEGKEKDEKSPDGKKKTTDPSAEDLKKRIDSNMWHSMGPLKSDEKKLIELSEQLHLSVHSEQFFEGKVKMVGELLSKLKLEDKEIISKRFLAMSTSRECSTAIRQLKSLPVLVGLIHGSGSNRLIRDQATKALNNIVHHGSDTKHGRREILAFKYVEEILQYCERVESDMENPNADEYPNITQTVVRLMNLSFNEEYRRAMCDFGALHALARLLETDHRANHGEIENLSPESILTRRYAAMALTNLTFRDSTNKMLLCSFDQFMRALVAQLRSSNEDLCQVTGSVLRNLSWRADTFIKNALREVDAVTLLMKAALRLKKESASKSVLSALWNLSAHCNLNKVDICNVDGAIEYLVTMLNYQAPSGTLVILENIGGIFRNVCSLIAVRDDYRAIIRHYNCLYILLHQLKSPSLTVVSNACGALWNLSARCPEDQETLIHLGAIDMLRSLVHSKHKMISLASSAALKNLTNARVDANLIESGRIGTLAMRKRRALAEEMDAKLRESSDGTERDVESVDAMKCSERSFSGKNDSMQNADFNCIHSYADSKSTNDDVSMTRSVNSVRFNLPVDGDERDKENQNPSSPGYRSSVNAGKSILKQEERKKLKENGYGFDESCGGGGGGGDDDDTSSSKTNGYRKIEEPYNVDDSFGDYAETDIDQPTNYSLRFSEQRADVERCEMTVAGTVESSPSDKKSVIPENVCLETPLMFSRSSSLDSVSTSSVQGDDQGSVVSEVSHIVSGVISPSDLPASPLDTVPPSPRSSFKNNSFYAADPKPKPPIRKSVFEDSVTVFKDENTPNQFSVATSLSSLTFDDETHFAEELEPVMENCVLENQPQVPNSKMVSSSNSATSVAEFEEKEDCLDVELSPEEQQAVLNACIDSGMPAVQKYCPAENIEQYSLIDHPGPLLDEDERCSMLTAPVIGDSTINYCTEDTPVSISHAASNSDLSLLCPSEDSFLQNSILPLSSCLEDQDVIELPDEEQEKLLNMCIATGQSLNYNSNNSVEGRSSQSSTLSEITEDLPIEEHTLLQNMTESGANLVTMTYSTTENDYSIIHDSDGRELSDEQSENLLNQCIALGMQNMKEIIGRDVSDLENIGPPSFLAEANLDSSLSNVEEIMEYPPTKNEKLTPRQKRHQMKDRYNTYTVKLSPSKTTASPKIVSEGGEKTTSVSKDRKSAEKDRFKTRTLTKGDFEELAKSQETNLKPPKSPVLNGADESGAVSENENYQEINKAKITKPVTTRAKSGIPVVKGKPPATKSPANGKSNPTTELPVNLLRQNTFTKDEPSAIPVRKNSLKGNAKPVTNESSLPFKSGIPSRIKEPSIKFANGSTESKSPDIAKNRWSISENNLSASSALKASNTSLNVSPTFVTSKVSPSASHSALPIRRETSVRSCNLSTYKK